MRQFTSLAWKEWREDRAFLWIALGIFLGLPVIQALEAGIHYAHGFEIEAAPWVGICRRCAEPVTGELRIPVHERYADAPLAGASDDELYPISDDTIDLAPLARDAVVLELPMAPLCREDCAGLCVQCGANRNEGDCGCVAPRDPRWANLDVLR